MFFRFAELIKPSSDFVAVRNFVHIRSAQTYIFQSRSAMISQTFIAESIPALANKASLEEMFNDVMLLTCPESIFCLRIKSGIDQILIVFELIERPLSVPADTKFPL